MTKLTLLTVAIAFGSIANAGSYTFTPSNTDLSDLDHYYAYSWGIDFTVPRGEVITGAQLTIKNIWDWTVEEDVLYVNMLDNPGTGVKSFYDDQGGADYFGGQGTKVGQFSDPVGGRARSFDLTFDLGQLGLLTKMNQYAADGKLGFGFDPDCHYFNDGVILKIQTSPVPEPATMSALALGGLALLRRRKTK